MFYDRALPWCLQSQPLIWHFHTSWSYNRQPPFSVSYWHFYQFWYTLILHYLSSSSFALSCPTDFRLYGFQCCWPWSKYTCFIKYVNNGNVNSTLKRWFEYDIQIIDSLDFHASSHVVNCVLLQRGGRLI